MTALVTSASAVMNILLVVLIVFSTAQENHGLQNKQDIVDNNRSRSSKSVNTTLTRTKRYATHMNSLLRDFNFFNNDECPPSLSGERRFYCPSKNERNEWICVKAEQICDTRIDCPNAKDEDEFMCFYHRPVSYLCFLFKK